MALLGIKLNFRDDGKVDFDFNKEVEGFDLTVQNSIVNLVTEKGSDQLFQEKGTSLAQSANKGRVIDTLAIAHECNFAALETLKFQTESEPEELEEDYRLQNMTVSPGDVDQGILKVNTKFESLGGTVLDSTIGIKVI
jgi:hypothetical protein